MSRDRDDWEKPTWRERDATRGPKPHRSDADRAPARAAPRAALERAFESGKLGDLARVVTGSPIEAEEEARPAAPSLGSAPPADPAGTSRRKLGDAIKVATDRNTTTRAVNAYLAAHLELPGDFEILSAALKHKDDAQILSALARLDTLLDTEKPRRAGALNGHLRMLEDTVGDPELQALAGRVRKKL